MKSPKLLIVSLLLFGALSCKKSNIPAQTAPVVSNVGAANIIAGSLLYGSGGVASTFEDATDVAGSLSLNINSTSVAHVRSKNTNLSFKNSANAVQQLRCGTTYPDSVFRQGEVGSADIYTYNSIYNFTLNCNNSVPDNVTGSSIFWGNYIGVYALATDTGSSSFTVAGLPPTDTALTFSGTYKRSGSFISAIDTSSHGIYNITMSVSAISYLKPSYTQLTGLEFKGGTATIAITGNVPKKGAFSYIGTLVFSPRDNGTATLTLAGTAYIINLTTGIIALKI